MCFFLYGVHAFCIVGQFIHVLLLLRCSIWTTCHPVGNMPLKYFKTVPEKNVYERKSDLVIFHTLLLYWDIILWFMFMGCLYDVQWAALL